MSIKYYPSLIPNPCPCPQNHLMGGLTVCLSLILTHHHAQTIEATAEVETSNFRRLTQQWFVISSERLCNTNITFIRVVNLCTKTTFIQVVNLCTKTTFIPVVNLCTKTTFLPVVNLCTKTTFIPVVNLCTKTTFIPVVNLCTKTTFSSIIVKVITLVPSCNNNLSTFSSLAAQ